MGEYFEMGKLVMQSACRCTVNVPYFKMSTTTHTKVFVSQLLPHNQTLGQSAHTNSTVKCQLKLAQCELHAAIPTHNEFVWYGYNQQMVHIDDRM